MIFKQLKGLIKSPSLGQRAKLIYMLLGSPNIFWFKNLIQILENFLISYSNNIISNRKIARMCNSVNYHITNSSWLGNLNLPLTPPLINSHTTTHCSLGPHFTSPSPIHSHTSSGEESSPNCYLFSLFDLLSRFIVFPVILNFRLELLQPDCLNKVYFLVLCGRALSWGWGSQPVGVVFTVAV